MIIDTYAVRIKYQIDNSSLKKVQRQMDGLQKKANSMFSKIPMAGSGRAGEKSRTSNLRGKVAGAVSAVGVAATLKSSMSSAIMVEKGMIAIAKTTGLAGDELKGLESDILSLGRKSSMPIEKLLELGEAAGQMNISNREDILQYVKTVSQLTSAATGIDATQAGLDIAKILGITGDSDKNIDRITSSIVRMGNEFKTNEANVIATAKRIAQATAAFKFSSPEVVGYAAAMDAAGVSAELAGSTIGRTLAKIEAAALSNPAKAKGKRQKGLFEKMIGEDSEKTLERFRKGDAEGVFKDFVSGLKKLDDAYKRNEKGAISVTDALDSMGVKDVQLKTVLPTLAGSIDEVTRALLASREGYKQNSALSQEAATAAQSLSAKMGALSNSWTWFKVKLANAGLFDLMTNLMNKAGEMVEKVSTAFNDPEVISAINSIKREWGILRKALGDDIEVGWDEENLVHVKEGSQSLAKSIADMANSISESIKLVRENFKSIKKAYDDYIAPITGFIGRAQGFSKQMGGGAGLGSIGSIKNLYKFATSPPVQNSITIKQDQKFGDADPFTVRNASKSGAEDIVEMFQSLGTNLNPG